MSSQPQPVLVGIDGTPAGLEALALGGALAVLTGSPLVLGAVFGTEGELWPPEHHVDEWLQEAAQRLGDAIHWSTRTMLSTTPGHGLVALARNVGAGWIVLGSSHHGALGRMVIASVARTVIHHAPCAVAVVPHGWRLRGPEEPLRFGVAFTDSPPAHEALALAARMADAAHAPLRIYTAVPVPSPAHPMFAATGTSYEGWRREQRRDAERTANAAAAALAAGVETEVIVLDGDPVQCVAEASGELDLLFVGSRRRGPLRRTLLGSVSAPLIERAHAPVLVVPGGTHPEPAEQEAQPSGVHA